MIPEDESKLYLEIERAVIWGHTREEVFRLMASSGLTGPPAEALFRRAWAERVSMIRAEALGQVLKGAAILAGGIAVFCVFWLGFGAITRKVFILCGVAVLFGGWWAVDGLMNWILAPRKEGSLV